ncbi:hypothetical protein [Alicyclobacillus sp. ALC3]|uniref:hypothetical protein n=1 Tax=Alicyclobacillus sp. ALC3 TaxID=2796143 RepID=UPI00237985C4|nr:hypothetical protein [Alicyclobacillus sp. ALC3]WDL99218.1 hypothetical protein JC200_11555 [Alicyclobacillus sp. ALC3]
MTTNVIAVSEVTRRYGQKRALDDASFAFILRYWRWGWPWFMGVSWWYCKSSRT